MCGGGVEVICSTFPNQAKVAQLGSGKYCVAAESKKLFKTVKMLVRGSIY